MVDARYGTSVGAWLMHGLVHVFVHGICTYCDIGCGTWFMVWLYALAHG